ncbi:hypothetical protein BJV74DRAFT_799726 [Russula compacta]|nr:hypothetical protein BJV74DRAFT_799726 [Russula compacta]
MWRSTVLCVQPHRLTPAISTVEDVWINFTLSRPLRRVEEGRGGLVYGLINYLNILNDTGWRWCIARSQPSQTAKSKVRRSTLAAYTQVGKSPQCSAGTGMWEWGTGDTRKGFSIYVSTKNFSDSRETMSAPSRTTSEPLPDYPLRHYHNPPPAAHIDVDDVV